MTDTTTGSIEAFEVQPRNLHETRVAEQAAPPLVAGQALLTVDRFGLTSNNVTYGVAGDMIGYWKFFPAEGGWGRIPVWGFADVVDSTVDGLPNGARVFGYLPMATHLVVEPTKVSPTGFTDGAEHRAALPAVYNQYRLTSADPMYRADTEEMQAIFFPLFVTSFVLDDYLADHHDFGADQIVISSASSKTSAGTALCTTRRTGPRPKVVGLTSPSRVDFVDGLGCYDEVLPYDDVNALDRSSRAVFVDVAGDAAVRRAVHTHFGDQLAASSAVGLTHWDAFGGDVDLPGVQPEMFFAPSQIEKRTKEWGRVGYQERLAAAWALLLDVASDWVHTVERHGFDELRATYLAMLDGDIDPSEATIITLD